MITQSRSNDRDPAADGDITLSRVIYIIHGTDGDDRLSGSNRDEWYSGRDGNDQINAGGGQDILNGGAGDDTLNGGDGVDLALYEHAASGVTVDLTLTGAQDTIGGGRDTLVSIEDLTGSPFADFLYGNSGANVLDGSGGADLMRGGRGDDTYYVDAGDTVIEYSTGGFDRAYASSSFVLTSNIEVLTLTGTGNFSATGNMLDNEIVGNSGHNTLDGRGGADTMAGGLGNDTYYVNLPTDQTVEALNAGTDTVHSRYSWTLSDNMEQLVLDGVAVRGAGNALGNTITGNAAANLLDGLAGNDMLHGGTGADRLTGGLGRDLLYLGADTDSDTVRYAGIDDSVIGADRDRVYDFVSGTDKLDLRQIDADSATSLNQAFAYSATGPAAHAVWVVGGSTNAMVRGDVNGDAAADFEIVLMNVASLTAADFLL